MARSLDGRGNDAGADPLDMLEVERRRLQESHKKSKAYAQYKTRGTAFWGILGGFCLAADAMGAGGLMTAFAGYKAMGAVSGSLEARRVEKQLKEVREKIISLHEDRARYQMEHPAPKPDQNLTEEFSPAARREIEALREQLRELDQQVNPPPADLGKPQFKLRQDKPKDQPQP